MVAKPGLTSVGGNHSAQAVILTIANTVSNEVTVWINNTGQTARVTQASFIPEDALTGAATNNLTLQFRNKGLVGTGTTGITAIKTYASGTDIAAFDEDALVLSTTLTELDVAAGEVVALNKAENGTGLTLPAGIASLTFQFSQ